MFPGSAARLEVLSLSLHVLTKCDVLAALQVDSGLPVHPACPLSNLHLDLRLGLQLGAVVFGSHTQNAKRGTWFLVLFNYVHYLYC